MYYNVFVCYQVKFFWCLCMATNGSVQCNGGLLPDTILLTQCYYHQETRLNAIKMFCLRSLRSHLSLDIFPLCGMLRKSRCVQIFL